MNFRVESTGQYLEWLISDGVESRKVTADPATPEGFAALVVGITMLMGDSTEVAYDIRSAIQRLQAGEANAGPCIAELHARLAAAVAIAENPRSPQPIMQRLSEVPPRIIPWLWGGRIPLGRLSLLAGRPGEGKSFLTTDLCARVSTGSPWPDGQPGAEPASVLLVCGEDDAGDTIRPRLDAHRADTEKIHILKGFTIPAGDDCTRKDCYLDLSDIGEIDAALSLLPDCRLMIVDPIGSFLGRKTDAHRDNEVRSILAPIGKLAEAHNCAVLMVAHHRKSGGDFADDMILGSKAFTGIARVVWHLSLDPENEDRRLLLPGKNNLARRGTGLAFTIAGEPPKLWWEADPVEMSADAGMQARKEAADGRRDRPSDVRDNGAKWLASELRGGARKASEIRDATNSAGYNWRTIQRAAEDLGVVRKPLGFGTGYSWELPQKSQ